MENLGVYFRATKDEYNILINIIRQMKDVISYEIIQVDKDTFSHEHTGIYLMSRKVYKDENLLYIFFKNEERRIRQSYNLQDISKIKFDFFLEENLEIRKSN